jgi:hypothetical protein
MLEVEIAAEIQEPPYVVQMLRNPNVPPEGELVYLASGWAGLVTMRVTGPQGPLGPVGVDAEGLNAGLTGASFDRPGPWVIEIEDATCFRRLHVTVKPPGG